jgi:hypothetical protein
MLRLNDKEQTGTGYREQYPGFFLALVNDRLLTKDPRTANQVGSFSFGEWVYSNTTNLT